MKYIFQLLAIVTVFSACESRKAEINSKVTADSTKREVLRYTVLRDSTKASIWTPTDNHIRSLEVLIKNAINEYQSKNNDRLKPDSLTKFYRQYTCYVENGDSIVFVNAFCRVRENYEIRESGNLLRKRFDWQHKFLQVEDGGDCYWQTIISFSKGTIKAFVINGQG